MEYFELYSNLLELVQSHPALLDRLKLNERILTKSVVELYRGHSCTESSLNSKPDHVAQGFLRILNRLLSPNTEETLVPFVRYLFEHSLFPEHGKNKLKNSKSRHEAYELVHQICARPGKTGANALKELFAAGFKRVYKRVSEGKGSSALGSYYSNYNEARSEVGYSGIRNLGCVCYMIAMLQQLFMTVPLRYLTLMADDGQAPMMVRKGSKEIDDNIFHQLQILFAHLQLTERQDYNPDALCFSFKDFDGVHLNVTVQQDAQEFLNLFFDKMECALKLTPFRRIFEDTYAGRTCVQMVCSCGAVKERFESFYPLSLEVKGVGDIHTAFRKYIAGEVIADYQCDSCSKKTEVNKSSYLAETPNYFIVHLTRICFNYDKFENEKVNTRWEFPHSLNVWDYSLDCQQGRNDTRCDYDYTLKGVVLHYGTADFGHYFSYIKESQDRWIEFNDERVREFDPRDIETDCFGGENWRRDSQSAYLCVYEKVHKRPFVLEFDSNQEKDQAIAKFNLKSAVLQEDKGQTKGMDKNKAEGSLQESSEQQILAQQETSKLGQVDLKQKVTETQIEEAKQSKQAVIEKKKVKVRLEPSKIGKYVPEELQHSISKQNEEFSFSLNVSNEDFAHFLYRVLSIEPPVELTTEYLELCYQCFSLKQVVDEDTGLTLSEWAARRFKQIVKGHGYQFLKRFGRNWETDILHIDKPTRVGVKNLLECVISDIIHFNGLNQQFEQPSEQKQPDEQLTEQQSAKKSLQKEVQKQSQTIACESSQPLSQLLPTSTPTSESQQQEIVIQFLDKLLEMMGNQVTKQWCRFREYFEVWAALVEANPFVRRWCEEQMVVEKLLDFLLEEDSPFARGRKRSNMGSSYYSPEFEWPLQVLTLLVRHGYELNDMEVRCMKYYAFMAKVINFPTRHFDLVAYLCKNDAALSEKFAYLMLTETARVNQSDSVKPIIAVMHSFLAIDDSLARQRKEWLIGIPQFMENSRTGSFGIYGLNVAQQYVNTYFSPVRASPILLQLIRFRTKAHHVAALLLSMVLQLEHDGIVHNLEEYPAMDAFEKDYTHWVQAFVDTYYEETHRPYMSKHYVEYGNRLRQLWNERPHREILAHDQTFYLVGKTLQKNLISDKLFLQVIQIKTYEVISDLLPMNSDDMFELINKDSLKNFKNFEGSDNFKFKSSTSYAHSGHFIPAGDLPSSEQDEQGQVEKPLKNPFEQVIQGTLFRKCVIKNLSSENLLVTVRVLANKEKPVNNLNAYYVAQSPISFQIKADSVQALTFMKKNFSEPFGQFAFEVSIIGKSTRQGFWPRQIITPVPEQERGTAAAAPDPDVQIEAVGVDSDQESNEDWH